MNADYKYKLAVCDVADKRTLESYRAKRATWLSWINTDEHHAIWDVLAGMVWDRCFVQIIDAIRDRR
jgi:hypothetical protein